MSAAAVATIKDDRASSEEEKKESLSRSNSKTQDTQDDDSDEQRAAVREVAELAAGAAHRKSLDDEMSGSLLKSNNVPSPPRQLARRKSSGPPRTSSSGLRAMALSRSLGERDAPRGPLNRTSSMHAAPMRRSGVHRSQSSDMSSMRMMMASASGRTSLSRASRESSILSGGAEPVRGVRRAQSSIAPGQSGGPASRARLAPDRRGVGRADSARGVPSRRGVGRTCSQNSLNHMSQNAGNGSPQRGGGRQDESAGVRPYRGRDGLVNMSIGVPMMRTDSNGNELNLLRRSVDDRSVGDMSNFTMATMDSVNLRKQQIVADPLDDAATYREQDSCADHESVFTMATGAELDGGLVETVPQMDPNHVPYDGVSVADTIGSLDDFGTSGGDPYGHHPHGAHYPLEEDTNHSRPNHIACDTVSLSTIGGEMEEGIDESDSFLGIGEEQDEDYESTIHEELLEEDDENDDDDDDDDDDDGGDKTKEDKE